MTPISCRPGKGSRYARKELPVISPGIQNRSAGIRWSASFLPRLSFSVPVTRPSLGRFSPLPFITLQMSGLPATTVDAVLNHQQGRHGLNRKDNPSHNSFYGTIRAKKKKKSSDHPVPVPTSAVVCFSSARWWNSIEDRCAERHNPPVTHARTCGVGIPIGGKKNREYRGRSEYCFGRLGVANAPGGGAASIERSLTL